MNFSQIVRDLFDRIRVPISDEILTVWENKLKEKLRMWPVFLLILITMHILCFAFGWSTMWVYPIYMSGLIRFFVLDTISAISTRLTPGFRALREEISENLTGIGQTLTDRNNLFTKTANGFNKHKLGLSSCVYSIAKADNIADVGSELVKIGSMLEFETSTTDVVLGGLASRIGSFTQIQRDHPIPNLDHHALDPKKLIGVLGLGMAMTGKSASVSNMSRTLKTTHANIAALKVIYSTIEESAISLGLIEDSQADLINQLTADVASLRKDSEWISECLCVTGNEFLKPKGKQRLAKLDAKLLSSVEILTQVERGKLERSEVVILARQIITEVTKQITQVRMIQARKPRVVPAGICLFGESQVGKTTLANELKNRIAARAEEKYPQYFFGSKHWTMWNSQQRDEYDQNYRGDEFAYEDDAFADRSNQDHLKYLSFISGGATSTYQADLKEKGLPFSAKVFFTSTNTLPDKSCTINNVFALWERFPFTIHCKKRFRRVNDGNYDPDFQHLEFKMTSMKEMIGYLDVATRRIQPITLEEIVEQVVDFMAMEETKLQQRLAQEDRMFGEDQEMVYHMVEEEPLMDVQLNNPRQTVDRTILTAMEDYQQPVIDVLKSLRIAARAGPINSSLAFAPWALQLRHRTTNNLCTREHLANTHPYEFISALGVWRFETNDGYCPDSFSGFPAVIVENPLTTSQYLWMPSIHRGEVLILLDDALIEQLRSSTFYNFCRMYFQQHVTTPILNDREGFLRLLNGLRQTYLSNSSLAKITVLVVCRGMPAMNIYSSVIWSQTVINNINYHQRNWVGDDAESLLFSGLRVYNYTHVIKDIVWKKIEKYTEVFKDCGKRMLIKILEFLGVEIGPWMDSLCEMASDFIHQTALFGLLSLLTYGFYKIYELLFKKKEKKIKHHNKNYDGKANQRRNVRKTNRKDITLHQAYESCEEDCDSPDLGLNDLEWDCLGSRSELFDFKWFEALADQTNDGTFHYVSHNECNDFVCFEEEEMEDPNVKEGFHKMYHTYQPLNGNKQPMIHYRYKVSCSTPNKEQLNESIEILRQLNINEYYIRASVFYDEDEDAVSGELSLFLLNGMSKNRIVTITEAKLKSLFKNKNKTSTVKEVLMENLPELTHRSATTCCDLAEQVKTKNTVCIFRIENGPLPAKVSRQSFGIAHRNMIITNAHVFTRIDQLAAFWPCDKLISEEYRVAKVMHLNPETDEAYLKICRYSDLIEESRNVIKNNDEYCSLLSYLMPYDLYKERIEGSKGFIYVCNMKTLYDTQLKLGTPTLSRVTVGDKTTFANRELLQIKRISLDNKYVKAGQCGSPIFSYTARHAPSIAGIYSGSNFAEDYGVMLWKEKIETQYLYINPETNTEHHYTNEIPCLLSVDPFLKFIEKGEPVDSPTGPEVVHVGNYKYNTLPVSNTSLEHWSPSPWFNEFDELLQPAPLDPYDQRIEAELPTNRRGQPTLLGVLNQTISETIPDIDMELLGHCSRQIEEELYNAIGEITPSPKTLKQMLDRALNGHDNNQFVTGMELNKAAGIPWAELKPMKSDFIELDGKGRRSFKKDEYGDMLRNRVEQKLLWGQKGVRLISFSNAKLKDALVKMDYVKIGRGRIFHMIPVDKIIFDLALFGDFKEAYTKAGLKVHSAIGMNPHSKDVDALVDHLCSFDKFSDKDFTNFDQRLHRALLLEVFSVITNTIRRKDPTDPWQYARMISGIESIYTLVVEFRDITMTNRGNCSGEVMTTVVNNIARDLACYFCWCQHILDKYQFANFREFYRAHPELAYLLSLRYFRKNRRSAGFGDDETESISENIIEDYNFITMKEQLTKMGMVVTPGSKTTNIQPYMSINEISFLKRKFVHQTTWTMPLDKRSLEAPFTWTKVKETDFSIWYEIVKGRLYEEAVLHGEDYYENFREKLSMCESSGLLNHIRPLLTVPYHIAFSRYLQKKNEY